MQAVGTVWKVAKREREGGGGYSFKSLHDGVSCDPYTTIQVQWWPRLIVPERTNSTSV